jgi:hypothetical protein
MSEPGHPDCYFNLSERYLVRSLRELHEILRNAEIPGREFVCSEETDRIAVYFVRHWPMSDKYEDPIKYLQDVWYEGADPITHTTHTIAYKRLPFEKKYYLE